MNNYNFREREYPLREILKNEFINKSEMIKNEIGDRIKNYTGWAALHLLGNLDIHYNVSKEFVNKNQVIKDVSNSLIFYAKDGKITHITHVEILVNHFGEKKSLFVTTVAYTHPDHRRKGLFSKAREIMENGVIEYQRKHRDLEIDFCAMLDNPETQFLKKWFLKNGYRKVNYDGIIENTIELEKTIL